ncbi:MAG: amino acid adenylation domain-containing protein [Gemmatimonadota bacterium]
MKLHALFESAAESWPDRFAVVDPVRGKRITYGELERLTNALKLELQGLGADRGQRVGILAAKSIGSVAAVLGTLRAGAAYVPVDPQAPLSRAAEIFADCEVCLVIVQRDLVEGLRSAWSPKATLYEPKVAGQLADLASDLVVLCPEQVGSPAVEDLAYILYTSGSTGRPKGVMHTHGSARCFIDWCSETFDPSPKDRFSSHAPFHFDLSILDLYVPMAHGAAVVLVGEEAGKNPLLLAPLIDECEISVWYSTPSVLRLLVQYGGLKRYQAAELRLVLFAGEVFAPSHLRSLGQIWPGRRYFNLYGPTETNVCTSYEIVGEVPSDRVEPYPIGRPITGDRTLVLDTQERPTNPGESGELVVSGGTVMAGYWRRPDLNAHAFHIDAEDCRWYRTGDLVKEDDEGNYVFLGRRDRMVKRRGFRVELGEIEAALYRHPAVHEVAVVADSNAVNELHVRAFVCWRGGEGRPSSIALKRFLTHKLPLYMIPDSFTFLEQLPKTSTDKIDYVRIGSFAS